MIEIGDKVQIHLSPGHYLTGDVLYCAAGGGDCWHIKEDFQQITHPNLCLTSSPGALHYVQQFILMTKLE